MKDRSKRTSRQPRVQQILAGVVEPLEARAYLSVSGLELGSPTNLTTASVGLSPVFANIADFNGDGNGDLFVANSSNSVSVLLGKGDSTYQSPVTVPVGGTPLPLATGDFNNDHNLDIVAGTTGSPGNVSIILGHGDGTFGAATNIPALGSNHAIAVGDFNGDTNLDVISVSNNATANNNAEIIFGNGQGGMSTSATFTIPHGSISSVITGDFNNDGKEDFAVTDQADNKITVYIGNGNGTFRAPTDFATGSAPTSIVAADFTGDGKVDLVTANSTGGGISFLAGNGDGSFKAPVNTIVDGVAPGGGPLKVRLTDFNADGVPDLLVLLSPGSTADANALLGNGDGTFHTGSLINTNGGTRNAIAAGDLNGDALTDVIVSNSTSISTLLNVTNTDHTPPTAAVDATQAAGSTQSSMYNFTVTFTDNRAVNAKTLGDSNLTVTFPDMTVHAATLQTLNLGDGPTVQATYQIAFTDSSGNPTLLSSANNGTYTVNLAANSVSDANGNFAAAATIGTFALNVSAVQPPPVVGPSGDFTVSAPAGKFTAAVVTGTRQKSVVVTVTKTSGAPITTKSTISVTLFASPTDLAANGVALATASKRVKKLNVGQSFRIKFKSFNYPTTAGIDFIVASASLNGTADSNNAATSAITVAAPFISVEAKVATPTKPTLVAGKKTSVILNVVSSGNVKFSQAATVDVFASPSGALDGTQTQIASAVPIKVGLKIGQTKNIKVSFVPTTLPPAGTPYKIVLVLNLLNDTNPNTTISSLGTVTTG